MSGFFEKLRTIVKTGKKADSVNAVIPASEKKDESGRDIAGRKKWILGNLAIAMVFLLLLGLVFSLKQTRQNTLKIELAARMQEHNQRVPIIIKHVFTGRESAFEQLRHSGEIIDQTIALFSQGGKFRQYDVAPVTEKSMRDELQTVINNWQIEHKKIQFIDNNRQAFVNLGQAISSIEKTSKQTNKNLEELVKHMTRIGGTPHQLGAVSTMHTLTQNIFRSINVILPSKLPVTEIQNQLTHDRRQLVAIVDALIEGHDLFQFSDIDDKKAQEKLEQIKSSFMIIDVDLQTILIEIAAIIPAKAAANKLLQNNETMRNSIAMLNESFLKHDNETADLLQNVLLLLVTCAAAAIGWFVYAWRQSRAIEPQTSAVELDKTQQAMLRLLDDMRKMADGDLTVRTEVTEDITGAIADAVNFTIEELHTLVEQVNQASINVVKSSGKAQQISAQLLEAAQQQSSKIKETTIAVVNMAEAIGTVSDTAEGSTQVAKQSLTTAEKGGEAVRQAIAGMDEIRTHIQDTAKRIKRLGESSQEISEIVDLVSDITEQTNVLALNAALQASAAGEAGRGFNLIAQEVQRLAERSAEASKQISRLIKMIQNDTYDAIAAMERSTLGVTKGTQRSHAAGKALEEIEAVSKQLAQHVTDIYETTHVQTQAANTVIKNMEEILLITRQTTEGSQGTTAAIKKITGYASELKSSVSNFKV